jgi:hypothetical protein
VLTMARSLLKSQNVPTTFWGEAVATACTCRIGRPPRLSTALRRMRHGMIADLMSNTYAHSGAWRTSRRRSRT